MLPCLTLSIIRYGSRVKWSNPGKEEAPFSTPWCSSYRKGRLWVTLDYSRELFFTIIIKRINNYMDISSDKRMKSHTRRPGQDCTKVTLREKHHHHHHVMPQAWISLTLSRYLSLSFIASGRSSGPHPVS